MDRVPRYTALVATIGSIIDDDPLGLLEFGAPPDEYESVIVSLEFATEAAARQFERYLKSGSGRAFAKRHFP